MKNIHYHGRAPARLGPAGEIVVAIIPLMLVGLLGLALDRLAFAGSQNHRQWSDPSTLVLAAGTVTLGIAALIFAESSIRERLRARLMPGEEEREHLEGVVQQIARQRLQAFEPKKPVSATEQDEDTAQGRSAPIPRSATLHPRHS